MGLKSICQLWLQFSSEAYSRLSSSLLVGRINFLVAVWLKVTEVLFCLLASGQGPFSIPYHMSTWQLPHDCFHPRTQDQSLNSSVSDLHVVCLYFLILKFSLADIVHLHDFNYHDNSKINLSTYIALLWFWFFGCDLNVSWTFPLGWPRHFKLNRHKSALMIFSLQIQLISCFPYSLWKVLPFS